VALSVGSPVWWITLIGPIAMWYCLWKVTGIPYTEVQAVKSRGDAYRAYQKTTSPFFPWFPKESTE
jgi:steroid 5-alpha reductase family enzyme